MIISGGSTCYDGLPERLEAEMDKLCPTANMVKLVAPEKTQRYYSVYMGGSVLS